MALSRFLRRSPPTVGRVAFNMRPVEQAWGGGNQWLDQFERHLRSRRYDTRYDLRRRPDRVLLVDPRVGGNVQFGAEEIAALRVR